MLTCAPRFVEDVVLHLRHLRGGGMLRRASALLTQCDSGEPCFASTSLNSCVAHCVTHSALRQHSTSKLQYAP
jgi:hypothetical protein